MREAKAVRLGQWGLSNQVSHHIPYMYDYAGEPAKAAAIIREALSRTFTGSDIGEGYPGDEDNGEMSAWWLFSSLGFYPLQMGSPTYAVGSPQFTKATIHLENGKQIVINAPNNSPQNVYVQGLTVNGVPQSKAYLTQDQLANGAVLDFDMGPRPSAWGTGDQDVLPSITHGTSAPSPLQDLTGPNHGTASSSDGSDASKLFDNTSSTGVTFATKTPSITWDFAGSGTGTATYYTLTSGSQGGDPASWELQGSMNDVSWTTLDTQKNQSFPWRRYTRAFPIDNSKDYRFYRLAVTANSGADSTSLSEIELLGRPPATNPNRTLGAALSPQQSVVIPSAGTSATEKLTLDVQATAPGQTHVKVTPDAPQGWTVTPPSTVLTLNSNGSPAEGSVPLTVTVPAGTPDGNYTVAATVSASNTTAVRATATVTVAHKIDFNTGTAAEQPWLWDADSSQIDGASNRFADGDHYFIYRFPLPADTTSGTVTLSIDNEFLVQASSDGQHWTTVLTESQQVRDGSNKADRTIDIAPFLGTDKTVYIRVADSFPQDGWGGRVSHVSVTFN
jgi:hypothetical protein